MDGKPYNSSVFILLAVLKKVQDLSRFLNWESSLPVTTDIPDKLLSSSKYFSSFAFNIYNAALLDESDTKGIAEIFSIKSEDLMYAELQDDDGEGICPKFVFCVDHGSQSLVLTVRGTKSIKDALMDMVCDDSPFLSGFAHSGILSGTRKVWSLVGQTVISACQQHPQYKLVLTGTSRIDIHFISSFLDPYHCHCRTFSRSRCCCVADHGAADGRYIKQNTLIYRYSLFRFCSTSGLPSRRWDVVHWRIVARWDEGEDNHRHQQP